MSNIAEFPQPDPDILETLVEKALAGAPLPELMTVFFDEAIHELEQVTENLIRARDKIQKALYLQTELGDAS